MSSQLWISDASPLFFYSPAAAYFSGSSYNSKWTGVVDPSTPAPNNTLHQTGGPGGVILPAIPVMSFTPFWTGGNEYSVRLAIGTTPPASWTSGQTVNNFTKLEEQTFLITAQCATGQCADQTFGFKGAWVGTEYGPAGRAIQSVQLDDSSPIATYSGFAPMSSSSTTSESITNEDYQSTLSSTSTSGASASVTFIGGSIVVEGVTGPDTGSFIIDLDGATNATLDSWNDVVSHNVVLFFTSNLDTSKSHTLTITAQDGSSGGKTGLIIDSWTVYGPQGAVGFIGTSGGSTTTVGPTGDATIPNTGATGSTGVSTGSNNAQPTAGGSPNAGVIVGAVLGSLAGLFLLIWFFRKVMPSKTKVDKKLSPWDEANLLQNMKNEEVHITTAAKQRYVYPGLIAHSQLKK